MTTLEEVRGNQPITEWWAAVMAHPNFALIWKMLNEGHPLRFVESAQPTDASSSKRLGTIEGYELCLRRLELAAQFQAPLMELPPPSWMPPIDGDDETKQEQK